VKTAIVWLLLAYGSNGSPPTVIGQYQIERECLNMKLKMSALDDKKFGFGNRPASECLESISTIKE